ncbi:MAG: hypothetical protein K1V84_05095 [Muribaculaceae bacterium]
MKKILLFVAVAASLSFAACSSADKAANESADSFKSKIENCTNPDSLKIYVEQAKEYAQKLISEGKVDEAKKYLNDIQPTVEKYAPSLAGTLSTVKNLVDKVPASAESATDAATDSLKSAASDAVNAAGDAVNAAGDAVSAKANEVKDAATDKANEVKDAATDKANEVKDAATDKANEVKQNVKDGVDNAKQKSADAIQSAADKAKEALGK